MRTAGWTESESVLDRLTAVLEAFDDDDEGLGVSELARRARLPKSTVSRIAADLVRERLLDRDGDLLYLGVRLYEFGQSVEQPRRFRRVAHPVLRDLCRATGGSACAVVREGADVVVVSVVRGPADPGPVPAPGARLPAHATALGRAMLAFASPDALIDAAPDPAALRRALADIRRRGVAFDREAETPARCGVAVPVLDSARSPIAAIGVSGPATALHPESVAAAVRTAARSLGRQLAAAPSS